MQFEIITLFPELFDAFFKTSIIGRALEKGYFSENRIQLRQFALNKYGQVDDALYGGEPGMVLRPEPAAAAIQAGLSNCNKKKARTIFFTPQGKPLDQPGVREYAKDVETFVLFCGHYKGLDERVREKYIDDEISLGDYVLTGGELPAMVFIDAVVRLIENVLGNAESAAGDSFSDCFLEHPVYTRPELFEDMQVPAILRSGHHKQIDAWNRAASLERTYQRRPDLLEKRNLSQTEKEIINKIKERNNAPIN
jgi:tRNA (guanine37-N1)-methyltransferase